MRRLLVGKTLAFAAGLVPFALVGLVAAARARLSRAPEGTGDRGLPHALVPRALAMAERVFPGIVYASFGDRSYRLLRLEHPRRVRPGEVFTVTIELENVGEVAWEGAGGSHPLRLGTWAPPDAPSPFQHQDWIADNRPAEAAADTPVAGVATFRVPFRAPASPGTYRQELAPLAEGLIWFPARKIAVEVTVAP